MTRRAVALVALATFMGAACTSSAQPGRRLSSSTSIPPGRSGSAGVIQAMYRVKGHDLWMECTSPQTPPTLVFLHGTFGGRSDDLLPVINALATRRPGYCRYDRINAGRSGKEEERHTTADSVDDLRALIASKPISGPRVLVGYSFGGMLAIMYAATHPEDVAGIVLLDATMPFEVTLDPPEFKAHVKAEWDGQNEENGDYYDAFRSAAQLAKKLPPVPVVFLYATQQELPPGWAPGAYDRALTEFMDNLADGTIVRVKTTHDGILQSPEAPKQIQLMLNRIP